MMPVSAYRRSCTWLPSAGIVTEKGCIPKDGDAFGVRSFFKDQGLPLPDAPATAPALQPLDEASVVEYVASRPHLAAHVDAAAGGSGSAAWKCTEIGDGNINFVFVVSGSGGAVIVKQGLPYIRCVGESWPLSQARPPTYRPLTANFHALPASMPADCDGSLNAALRCLATVKPMMNPCSREQPQDSAAQYLYREACVYNSCGAPADASRCSSRQANAERVVPSTPTQ